MTWCWRVSGRGRSPACWDSIDRTRRVATAVSEVARNAFQYAGGARVEFLLEGDGPQSFVVRVCDRGPGIKDVKSVLDGRYTSPTGMGLGLLGARRLMDAFQIDSAPGAGTVVELGKALPEPRIDCHRPGCDAHRPGAGPPGAPESVRRSAPSEPGPDPDPR